MKPEYFGNDPILRALGKMQDDGNYWLESIGPSCILKANIPYYSTFGSDESPDQVEVSDKVLFRYYTSPYFGGIYLNTNYCYNGSSLLFKNRDKESSISNTKTDELIDYHMDLYKKANNGKEFIPYSVLDFPFKHMLFRIEDANEDYPGPELSINANVLWNDIARSRAQFILHAFKMPRIIYQMQERSTYNRGKSKHFFAFPFIDFSSPMYNIHLLKLHLNIKASMMQYPIQIDDAFDTIKDFNYVAFDTRSFSPINYRTSSHFAYHHDDTSDCFTDLRVIYDYAKELNLHSSKYIITDIIDTLSLSDKINDDDIIPFADVYRIHPIE